ncbi:MAG: FlgD immunoglobulin-like domain containing protein [Elusimicrobiota bacterium]
MISLARLARRAAVFFSAAIFLPSLALAIMPSQKSSNDVQRFGLEQLFPVVKSASYGALQAFTAFNGTRNWQWRARFDARTGAMSALIDGRSTPDFGSPSRIALSFLARRQSLLGIDPSALILEKQIAASGTTHLLFSQIYQGIPVEFAHVKVDVDQTGAVIAVHSRYEPALNLSVVPRIQELQAAQTAVADAGAQARAGSSELVVWPNRQAAGDNLAWRISVRTPAALWRYYIDADTGGVLFRYDDRRSAESGTVNGLVYAIDPSSSPASLQPFPYERVCVASASQCVTTASNGSYSNPASGEMFTQLQGLYLSVANLQGANAHYENGPTSWQTVSTPLSSPHPYAPGSVSFSTLNVSALAPNTVEFLPVFSNLNVGIYSTQGLGSGGEAFGILQDDELAFLDSFGNPIADYVGTFPSSFPGTAGIGQSLVLDLDAAGGGSGGYGYDVAFSSCLVLGAPGVSGNDNLTWWPSSYTVNGLHSEISLYYQLNRMHDYFANTMSALGVTGVTLKPTSAMALASNLVDAFYDPTHDDFFFGDINDAIPSDAFADDATVPHHEYTHYVVQKIWNIKNFGQAGAISEGNADYWSATSLNDPNIGSYVMSAVGNGYTPLRELDDNSAFNCPGAASCVPCSEGPHCDVLVSGANNNWTGEIHTDSIFFSQSLWDIRRALIAASAAHGQACAEEMEFQALLSFPESFSEFYDGLNAAINAPSMPTELPACAAAGETVAQLGTLVNAAFSAHGLILSQGQGFETAVDVTTMPVVQGLISTAGQTNFYTFGAGAGTVEITLTLPPSPDGQGYYSAYGITLYDRDHNIVAQEQPPLNGVGTGSQAGVNVCSSQDCTTTQQQVALSYNNSGANHFYVEIAGSPTGSGSNSGVNNSSAYSLSFSYSQAGALSGQMVNAAFDNDVISFNAATPLLGQATSYTFAYAQLRDQSQNILAQTQTNAAGFLAVLSTTSAAGAMTGQLQIQPGFSSRYPAVGTVYVEVFGTSSLGDTISFGLSNSLNLGANAAGMQAWNNIFNPLQGQKATVKFQIQNPGQVTIKIYTLSGMMVRTLLDADEPAGQGSVDWDGRNLRGSVVASGVYLVHMNGPGISKTQKIVVVK